MKKKFTLAVCVMLAGLSLLAAEGSVGEATGGRYRFIEDSAEKDVPVSSIRTRSYLYDGINPVSVTENGQSLYIGTDVRGSVRTLTDRYGSIAASADYGAFGNPLSDDASALCGLGYAGKSYDTATQLYNYGFRDYSPLTGRFTSVDPIRYGINWYVYVNNDPLNYVDLWGLKDVIAGDLVVLQNGKIRSEESGLKSRTALEVYRSPDDNGNNGMFYRSTMKVTVGDVVISSVAVQSTADNGLLNTDKAHEGGTIPLGEYTGTLLNKSGSYIDAISITGNGVTVSDAVLYHPNVKTALGETEPYLESGKPASLACQISTLEDFNTTMDTLHDMGFEGGSDSSGKSWVAGDIITIRIKEAERKKEQ